MSNKAESPNKMRSDVEKIESRKEKSPIEGGTSPAMR